MSDYIDRQAYIAALDYPEPEFFDDFRAGWIYGLNRAEAAARNFPAADVAPVVHGHWIMEANGGTKCSVCRWKPIQKSRDRYVFADMLHVPYCPMCGAKMDEGRFRA